MLQSRSEITSRAELLELVTQHMTPDAIRAAATTLGEDKDKTASAVTDSVPSVLEALSEVAKTDRGAAHIKEAIEAKSTFAHGGLTDDLLAASASRGDNLLDEEMGRGSWALSDKVALRSGLRPDSAHKLVGGVAAVALGTLAETHAPTTTAGLRSMLGNAGAPRRAVIDRAYVERAMGTPAIRGLERPRGRWWPLALLGLAAVIAIPLLLRAFRAPQPAALSTPTIETPAMVEKPKVTVVPKEPAPAAPQAAAPAAPAPAVAAGSAVSALAAFLASDEAAPRTFTLAPLNFAFNSKVPTQESISTIDDLAKVLVANPTTEIRLESHTDSIGNVASNEALSIGRSDAVKNLLVGRGVEESRISTAGMGKEQPVETNDTSKGGAENPRTDVIVTAK